MENIMYNATESHEQEQQRHIWTLEGKVNRAEKSARKHQKDAAYWRHNCRKAEKQLASIGQEAYDKGYMTGIGVGLMIGSLATIIDAVFWKRIFKK